MPPSAPPVPRIVLTPGEPAGIGPDLVVRLAQSGCKAQCVVVADPVILKQRARQLGIPIEIIAHDPSEAPRSDMPGVLRCLAIDSAAEVTPGRLNAANAPYVLHTLETALDGCLQGIFDAMVTGPVHKAVINDAGIPFTGHTEFLAERCRAPMPVMLLVAGALRVALATTHLPLAQVSAALTRERLEQVLRVMHEDLIRTFGIPKPRILVCGLNPHAGEGGHLGREEIDVIGPVLDALRTEGLDLLGPLPADTLFTPRYLDHADAVLAMYHDQGLPVLKYAGFGRAVNVTLGLPVLRTSVDHGTALELAGTGRAESGSLEQALALAIALTGRRQAALPRRD